MHTWPECQRLGVAVLVDGTGVEDDAVHCAGLSAWLGQVVAALQRWRLLLSGSSNAFAGNAAQFQGGPTLPAGGRPLDVPADAGHVFVLLADIRKLACDALALPMGGSSTGKVSNSTLQSRWLCYPRAVTELPPHSDQNSRRHCSICSAEMQPGSTLDPSA